MENKIKGEGQEKENILDGKRQKALARAEEYLQNILWKIEREDSIDDVISLGFHKQRDEFAEK